MKGTQWQPNNIPLYTNTLKICVTRSPEEARIDENTKDPTKKNAKTVKEDVKKKE